MYEPVLTDEKLDLYNVYEVHENYRILAMAVNVPLQVAKEICHILNEFEIKSLQPCPKCGHQPIIRENVMNTRCSIVCRVCGLTTGLFKYKQNLIGYCSLSGIRQIKEKILKITKSGTIYLRSKNCEDAIRFRKNGQWLDNFGYQGGLISGYSLKNPYKNPFDFTRVKI
jgi:hypothetical protein